MQAWDTDRASSLIQELEPLSGAVAKGGGGLHELVIEAEKRLK